MAKMYMATLLPGKQHIARTADGGLLCKDVVIARSGPLEYLASELNIPGGSGRRVTVWRDPAEVTDRRFLASCEGAVVTDQHPGRFVDPNNFQIYARGFMQNARTGPTDADGHTTALADLFIKDGGLADKVESGAVRDVSIGYNLDLVKDAIGRWSQVNLKVNHVAVVPVGRAGSTRIVDSAPVLGLTEMANLYLGKNPASVSVPTRAYDSRKETTMNDCYDDDLIPVGSAPQRKTARDEALRWLRQIRPQVVARGTRSQQDAWNALFVAVRDGAEPELALANVRRQFSAMDHTPAEEVQEVAEKFVKTCADYLGQDVHETAKLRRARARRQLLDSTSQETPAENFKRRAEEVGEEMRDQKKWGP